MRRLPIFLFLLAALCAGFAAAPATFAPALDRLVAGARGAGTVGIAVQSLRDGSAWYTRKADAAFLPASTLKLVTAGLALELLGPEYTYGTRVGTDGRVTPEGVIEGNLILRGGGDPLLTPDSLAALAAALATGQPRGWPGITHVTGKLILDDSAFPRAGPLLGNGWADDDLPNAYAAPAAALAISRNALTIIARGREPGQPAEIILDPPTTLFTVSSSVITGRASDTGDIVATRSGWKVIVRGCVPPGGEAHDRVSIPDPARVTGELFRAALAAQGVAMEGRAAAPQPDGRKLWIVEHRSPPLGEIIVPMLKESDNCIAEQLRWTLLAQCATDAPLAKRYPAVMSVFGAKTRCSLAGITAADGSGLSRLSAVTPSAEVRLLAHMAQAPYADLLSAALPIAGVDGTLAKRMAGTAAAGNIRAKTGTLTGSSALAGYATTADGEPLAFAILCQGNTSASAARALQDAIATYLAGVRRDVAEALPAAA
jgi:PBP4 family serine-type D-alanyl-D-alanine carboxypeptidase